MKVYDDETMRFIEVEVLFSGRGSLTSGEHWQYRGNRLLEMAPGRTGVSPADTKNVPPSAHPWMPHKPKRSTGCRGKKQAA